MERDIKRAAAIQRSPWVMPILVLTALSVAAFFAWGNPVLWETVQQLQCRTCEPAFDGSGDTGGARASEVISSFETSSQLDDAARAANLALAATAIDGTVVAPGETFSFNEVVGDTENDPRYQDAPIVADSSLGLARGGGICQLSSTLYVAALEADMEIIERHPHTILVDYAPFGLDATIEYNAALDLRIKNISDDPITIRARSQGQSVRVELVGMPLPDGITIKTVTKPLVLIDPEGNELSADGFDPRASAGMHLVVESFREFYRNGVLLHTQDLGRTMYLIYGDQDTDNGTTDNSNDTSTKGDTTGDGRDTTNDGREGTASAPTSDGSRDTSPNGLPDRSTPTSGNGVIPTK